MEPLNYLNFGYVYNPDHQEVVREKRKVPPNQEEEEERKKRKFAEMEAILFSETQFSDTIQVKEWKFVDNRRKCMIFLF